MFSLTKPKPSTIEIFLEKQRRESPTYAEVGLSKSADKAPRGYRLDHYRSQLGEGEEVYAHAVKALYDWTMYRGRSTEIHPPDEPVARGATIAILAHHLGFWSLNSARIVYKLDELTPVRRCGFALGTLSEHAAKGEERYTVELHGDGSVWFEVLAYSRPNNVLAWLGYPFTRRVQRGFIENAQDAMRKAVNGG